jgi:hypothetical protein
MSASHAPLVDVIVFQLMATLEQYELDVERLVASWLDMECYREVSERIEAIRGYSAALPQLSAQWVELLIAHAELVHCLWRSQNLRSAEREPLVAAALRQHGTCIRTLHERCRTLLLQRPDSA